MGRPILLLRLEGPLQSWGFRARWSRRDTGPEPTKSAIIGLLGCAAGIRRPDWRSGGEPDRTLEEWDRALRFGVRADRPGVMETDYHTVEGPHWQADGRIKRSKDGVHTEQTWRDYLHDAAFLVALAADEGTLLSELKTHLVRPNWPQYLGRKACVPTRPVLDRLTDEYDDLESALRSEPLASSSDGQDKHQIIEAWIEYSHGEYERPDALRINALRFYDYRRCRRIEIDAASLPRRES